MRTTELDEIFTGHGKPNMNLDTLEAAMKTYREGATALKMLYKAQSLRIVMMRRALVDHEYSERDSIYEMSCPRDDLYYTIVGVLVNQVNKARDEILAIAPNLTIAEAD